ncbi:MAG: hypothetical protein GX772_01110 [Alcaligenaceae bacterium]|nr:hypothetical protein [Alcaligenaceae bacterium]
MTLRHRRRPSAPVTATRSAAQAPTAINPAAKAAAFAPRLSLRNVLNKSVRAAFDWKSAMNQFAIMFGDRFTQARG